MHDIHRLCTKINTRISINPEDSSEIIRHSIKGVSSLSENIKCLVDYGPTLHFQKVIDPVSSKSSSPCQSPQRHGKDPGKRKEKALSLFQISQMYLDCLAVEEIVRPNQELPTSTWILAAGLHQQDIIKDLLRVVHDYLNIDCRWNKIVVFRGWLSLLIKLEDSAKTKMVFEFLKNDSHVKEYTKYSWQIMRINNRMMDPVYLDYFSGVVIKGLPQNCSTEALQFLIQRFCPTAAFLNIEPPVLYGNSMFSFIKTPAIEDAEIIALEMNGQCLETGDVLKAGLHPSSCMRHNYSTKDPFFRIKKPKPPAPPLSQPAHIVHSAPTAQTADNNLEAEEKHSVKDLLSIFKSQKPEVNQNSYNQHRKYPEPPINPLGSYRRQSSLEERSSLGQNLSTAMNIESQPQNMFASGKMYNPQVQSIQSIDDEEEVIECINPKKEEWINVNKQGKKADRPSERNISRTLSDPHKTNNNQSKETKASQLFPDPEATLFSEISKAQPMAPKISQVVTPAGKYTVVTQIFVSNEERGASPEIQRRFPDDLQQRDADNNHNSSLTLPDRIPFDPDYEFRRNMPPMVPERHEPFRDIHYRGHDPERFNPPFFPHRPRFGDGPPPERYQSARRGSMYNRRFFHRPGEGGTARGPRFDRFAGLPDTRPHGMRSPGPSFHYRGEDADMHRPDRFDDFHRSEHYDMPRGYRPVDDRSFFHNEMAWQHRRHPDYYREHNFPPHRILYNPDSPPRGVMGGPMPRGMPFTGRDYPYHPHDPRGPQYGEFDHPHSLQYHPYDRHPADLRNTHSEQGLQEQRILEEDDETAYVGKMLRQDADNSSQDRSNKPAEVSNPFKYKWPEIPNSAVKRENSKNSTTQDSENPQLDNASNTQKHTKINKIEPTKEKTPEPSAYKIKTKLETSVQLLSCAQIEKAHSDSLTLSPRTFREYYEDNLFNVLPFGFYDNICIDIPVHHFNSESSETSSSASESEHQLEESDLAQFSIVIPYFNPPEIKLEADMSEELQQSLQRSIPLVGSRAELSNSNPAVESENVSITAILADTATKLEPQLPLFSLSKQISEEANMLLRCSENIEDLRTAIKLEQAVGKTQTLESMADGNVPDTNETTIENIAKRHKELTIQDPFVSMEHEQTVQPKIEALEERSAIIENKRSITKTEDKKHIIETYKPEASDAEFDPMKNQQHIREDPSVVESSGTNTLDAELTLSEDKLQTNTTEDKHNIVKPQELRTEEVEPVEEPKVRETEPLLAEENSVTDEPEHKAQTDVAEDYIIVHTSEIESQTQDAVQAETIPSTIVEPPAPLNKKPSRFSDYPHHLESEAEKLNITIIHDLSTMETVIENFQKDMDIEPSDTLKTNVRQTTPVNENLGTQTIEPLMAQSTPNLNDFAEESSTVKSCGQKAALEGKIFKFNSESRFLNVDSVVLLKIKKKSSASKNKDLDLNSYYHSLPLFQDLSSQPPAQNDNTKANTTYIQPTPYSDMNANITMINNMFQSQLMIINGVLNLNCPIAPIHYMPSFIDPDRIDTSGVHNGVEITTVPPEPQKSANNTSPLKNKEWIGKRSFETAIATKPGISESKDAHSSQKVRSPIIDLHEIHLTQSKGTTDSSDSLEPKVSKKIVSDHIDFNAQEAHDNIQQDSRP